MCVRVWFPDGRNKNTLCRNEHQLDEHTTHRQKYINHRRVLFTTNPPMLSQGYIIWCRMHLQPSPRGSTIRLPEDEKFVVSNCFFLRCLSTSRNAPESACAIYWQYHWEVYAQHSLTSVRDNRRIVDDCGIIWNYWYSVSWYIGAHLQTMCKLAFVAGCGPPAAPGHVDSASHQFYQISPLIQSQWMRVASKAA